MPTFDIVVAAENNHYLQWQAMMLHRSCVEVIGRPPIIVVHVDDEPLLDGFQMIRQDGGVIQRADTLRYVGGVEYPPRNSAATLRDVDTSADLVVLCDADMLFLKPPDLGSISLNDHTITLDQVHYLDPSDPMRADGLDHACAAGGIDISVFADPTSSGGVPHLIPAARKHELANEWLRCIDLFPVIDQPADQNLPKYAYPKGRHHPWLAAMWAFWMAIGRLGLSSVQTSWCLNNRHGSQSLEAATRAEHWMLHYCDDTDGFSKRRFRWDKELTDSAFWEADPGDETIDGFIRADFLKTAKHFGLV